MSFFKWLLGIKEKRPEVEMPFHYAKVVYSDSALHDGVFDDFQKIILRIKGGVIVEKIPYSQHDVEALKKIYHIPVDESSINSAQEFQFNEMMYLSGQFLEDR